jgi:GTP cyclohydrolase IA
MMKKIDQEKIKNAVKDIIIALGENPDREGLLETPNRVAKMYSELCEGYSKTAEEIIKIFHEEESYEEIVLVKDIPVYSLCEHHLMPFFGKAHVAYIPKKGKITGLSKIARTVDVFAKRLQLQERLTKQIADSINKALDPIGVMVVIEAEHLCMTMRGIKKPGAKTVTSSMRGIFLSDARTRSEAMSLIK